jgi:hypothetical protein
MILERECVKISHLFGGASMRIVGNRKEQSITFDASAELLRIGAEFNTNMQAFPGGDRVGIERGRVWRFKNHEEANAHWESCQINLMVEIAMERGE